MNRRRFIKNAAGLLVPVSFGIFVPTSKAQRRIYAVKGSSTVAYDNTTPSFQIVTASTKTFAHVVTGATPAICVCVALIGTAQTVSNVSYAAASLSLIGTPLDDTNVPTRHLEWWGLANCATGSNNVVVTLSASNAAWDAVAISFANVATSSAFDGYQSLAMGTGSTTMSVTVTTGNANSMIVAGTNSASDNGIAPGAGQTQRWLDNSGSTNTMGDTKAGGASVVMTENWDSNSSSKAMAAFNINHA